MKRIFRFRPGALILIVLLFSFFIAGGWISFRLNNITRSTRSEINRTLSKLDLLEKITEAEMQLSIERHKKGHKISDKERYLVNARIKTQQRRLDIAIEQLFLLSDSITDLKMIKKLKLSLKRIKDFSESEDPETDLVLKSAEDLCRSQIGCYRQYSTKKMTLATNMRYNAFIRHILAGTLILFAIISLLIQNILRRLRIEKELKESRMRLDSILSSNPGAIYRRSNDSDWTMSFISEAIRHISGYSPGDFIKNRVRSYASIINPDDLNSTEEIIRKAIAGKSIFELEYRIISADGTQKWVYEKGHGIFSDMGELLYLDGAIIDVNKRKEAENERNNLQQQLLQSQKMESIGYLAGGVAHDFNNLLTPIISCADIITDELDPSSPIYQDVVLIKEAGDRAAELTRHLLSFSRQQTLQLEAIDVVKEVESFGNILRRMIRENIELNFKLNPDSGSVKADRTLFQQMLMNLAINAQDALPEGGTITIETSKTQLSEEYAAEKPEVVAGTYSLISITDNGCGMSEDTVKRIFEPFFTTKDIDKGTGLGLAMVYGNVKQHGGHLSVYSELDHGTSFKIFLPQCHEDKAEKHISHSNPGEILKGMSILVVEDNPIILKLVKKVLTKEGVKIFDFDNPLKAIEFFSKHKGKLDLALLDVIMPEMDGPHLYKELKNYFPNIKVIYMSGYTKGAIEKNIDLRQEFNFLPKPFRKKELISKIEECLGS